MHSTGDTRAGRESSLALPPPLPPVSSPTYAAPKSTTHRPHMQSGIISRNAVAAAWSLFSWGMEEGKTLVQKNLAKMN